MPQPSPVAYKYKATSYAILSVIMKKYRPGYAYIVLRCITTYGDYAICEWFGICGSFY